MGYTKDLRSSIAKVMSKSENKRTTLWQYWIVDTGINNTLGVMLSYKNNVKLNWFCRKMEKYGWYNIDRTVLKNAGRGPDVRLNILVMRKDK